jgi:hypothetical protein
VQAAIDAVPAGNMQAVAIHIKPGTYKEKSRFPRKSLITMRGDNAAITVLTFNNSDASTGRRVLFGFFLRLGPRLHGREPDVREFLRDRLAGCRALRQMPATHNSGIAA